MPDWLDCVVGLGANLGDRRTTLQHAVAELGQVTRLVRVSPLFASEPVGGPPQPLFENAAVRVHARMQPHRLLDLCQSIERSAGRRRSQHWGPRSLDLDILWIRGLALNTVALTVPHPRLTERAFALLPLLSVAPEAIDPVSGRGYASVARGGSSSLRVVAECWC